jgi:hypothetical protein
MGRSIPCVRAHQPIIPDDMSLPSLVPLANRGVAFGLRPLYCPWPRCFVYHTIAFGAAFTLPCCVLRGTWGDATMTVPGGAGTPYVTIG